MNEHAPAASAAAADDAVAQPAVAKPPRAGSLTRRMIGIAAVWIAALLLMGGLALDRVLTQSIVQNFDDQLQYVLKNALIAGDIRLDTRSGKVTKAGEPVKLTAQEYKLLSYLMHHKGKVVSRTELIEHIYDQDFDRDSNTIEVFVTRIRKKLGADVITTIRGLGYSLEEPKG